MALTPNIVNFKHLPFSAFDDLKERVEEIKSSFTDNKNSESDLTDIYHMTSRLGVKYRHAIKSVNH